MDYKDIFVMIAQTAMAIGCEISLEQKNYKHNSKVLGSMNTSETEDTGLILRAYPPQPEEAEPERAEDKPDDKEDIEDEEVNDG